MTGLQNTEILVSAFGKFDLKELKYTTLTCMARTGRVTSKCLRKYCCYMIIYQRIHYFPDFITHFNNISPKQSGLLFRSLVQINYIFSTNTFAFIRSSVRTHYVETVYNRGQQYFGTYREK